MGARFYLLGALLFMLLAGGSQAARAATSGSPVVLVHGWHGSGATDTLAGSSMSALGERLAADGHDVIWATGVAVDPAASMFDSADALAAVVERAALDHPGQPVRIVAHSYGGLVARAFLETERYGRLQRQGRLVSHLVTLGSPMGGIDLWLPLLFVLGDPLGEPSVWELTPAWMGQFNQQHKPPAGTRYTLVAGDARSQVPLLWLLPASDGAVTVASAHALPERALGLSEVRSGDVHTSTDYTRLLRWRSLMDNADTYRRLVRPGLLADGNVRPAAPAYAAAPLPAGFSHTPLQSVVLAPGETREVGLAPNGAVALLLAGDEGVRLSMVAADDPRAARRAIGNGIPALVPLAGAEDLQGRWGALAPVSQAGTRLRLANTSSLPRQAAWLGVLPAQAPQLSLVAQPTRDGLAVQLDASRPGLVEAEVIVLGQDGSRRQSMAAVPAGAVGGRTATAAVDEVTPGVYYIQATTTVDGWPIQTEITVVAE